jgi:hypothetical protein
MGGHVVRTGGMNIENNIWVGKYEEKKRVVRHRRKWEDNIK